MTENIPCGLWARYRISQLRKAIRSQHLQCRSNRSQGQIFVRVLYDTVNKTTRTNLNNMYKKQFIISSLLAAAVFPLSASAAGGETTATATMQQAQQGTVKGTVTDSNGDPITGASIKVVGSSKQGAITDIDGHFTLEGVSAGHLEFSYLGCKTKTVAFRAGQNLTVMLEDNSQTLDDVVVVGFATQKKVNLTGSVGVATSKDLEGRPVANALQALQGVVPGLNISNASNGGELNAQKRFNIRGTGTIGDGSNASPLVLIDGMEGDINTINPQDIENISVLKDAASSSIYGSRAPFGVILITTKSGGKGKAKINYNNSFRFNKPLFMPEMMNSWEYVNYLNDVTGYTSPGSYVYDEESLQKVYDYYTGKSNVVVETQKPVGAHYLWGSDENGTDTYANMNWLDEYYRKTAFAQEHNLSISGGSDKMDYYISGNLMDQGGFMRYGQDDYDRYTFTGKIGAQVTDWMKVNFSSRWTRAEYDRATAMSSGFYDNVMRRSLPTFPKYDPNGYIMSNYNYIEDLENGGRHKEQNDDMYNQFKVTITPLKNWNIIGEFNMRVGNNWTHEDRIPVYAHAADDPNVLILPGGGFGADKSSVYEYSYRETYLNGHFYSNYSFNIDKNNFAVMAGMQTESMKTRVLSGGNQDLAVTNLPVIDLTTSTEDYIDGNYQLWKTVGFFGRINYDYDSRYLFEFNARYDGTSRFRRGSRWVFSPSYSVGWNVAQENFWEPLRKYVNTLKPRISYGQLANQNTSSWYPTYRTMAISSQASSWLVNGDKPNTASFPGLISSTLTWEKIKSSNFGLDFGAFDNRLTGSFDYYIRKTDDMVGSGERLPAILGASVPKTNNLSLKTYGWELTIQWRDMIKDFSYGVRLNLSDDQTKILTYPNREGYISKYIPGMVTGNIYGLTTVGIAKTQEEMDAHIKTTNQEQLSADPWLAGDIMYKDINGDGKITKGTTINDLGDLKVIGNTTPRYRIGINLDASWKGFDIAMFWQGVLKRDYYFDPNGGQGTGGKSAVFWGATSGGRNESLFFKPHLDYFRADPDDPLGQNLDAYYARPLFNTNKNREIQTRYLQDASYLRLKNLQVGYTFRQAWLKKAAIESLRLYFSAENLLTITSLSDVLDPESLEVDKMKSGASYPLARTFSFGLSVTL